MFFRKKRTPADPPAPAPQVVSGELEPLTLDELSAHSGLALVSFAEGLSKVPPELESLRTALESVVRRAVELTKAERVLLLVREPFKTGRFHCALSSTGDKKSWHGNQLIKRVFARRVPLAEIVSPDHEALGLGRTIFDLRVRQAICVPLAVPRWEGPSVSAVLYADSPAASSRMGRSCLSYLTTFAESVERALGETVRRYVHENAPTQPAAGTSRVTPWIFWSEFVYDEEWRGQQARIDKYSIVRRLGAGGQAETYLARAEHSRRDVALKVLSSFSRPTEEGLAVVRREVEIASRVQDPGICRVYEVGVAEDGRAFIAMEYVEGETLADALSRARADGQPHLKLDRSREDWPRDVLEFFERLAWSLHAAHEGGIVHCDVKPSNIMVTPDGRGVILDFGLAHRPVDDRGFEMVTANQILAGREPRGMDTLMTVTGEFKGTPRYMSPEQIEGSRALQPTTDVFSLGVTLYECLTLQHPYLRTQPSTLVQLFEAIRRFDYRNPGPIGPGDGAELDAVLRKALSGNPEDRYVSAGDFADDLRALCEAFNRPERSGRLLWLRTELRWFLAELLGATSRVAAASGRSVEVLRRSFRPLARGLVLVRRRLEGVPPSVALGAGALLGLFGATMLLTATPAYVGEVSALLLLLVPVYVARRSRPVAVIDRAQRERAGATLSVGTPAGIPDPAGPSLERGTLPSRTMTRDSPSR